MRARGHDSRAAGHFETLSRRDNSTIMISAGGRWRKFNAAATRRFLDCGRARRAPRAYDDQLQSGRAAARASRFHALEITLRPRGRVFAHRNFRRNAHHAHLFLDRASFHISRYHRLFSIYTRLIVCPGVHVYIYIYLTAELRVAQIVTGRYLRGRSQERGPISVAEQRETASAK